MNFDLTEEQRLVVDTVAQYVKKELPITRARKLRRALGDLAELSFITAPHLVASGGPGRAWWNASAPPR